MFPFRKEFGGGGPLGGAPLGGGPLGGGPFGGGGPLGGGPLGGAPLGGGPFGGGGGPFCANTTDINETAKQRRRIVLAILNEELCLN